MPTSHVPSSSARTTPRGNTKVFIVWLCTICLAAAVSSARFGIIPLEGCTCNACSYALSSPNTVICSVINSSNASVVTLHVGSLLSINSFSKNFVFFDFLRACGDSLLRGLLPWGDFMVKFVRSYLFDSFYMSYSEDISWSSVISLEITSLVTSCSEAAFCPWRVLSASLVSRNWISFFHCYASNLSNAAMSGARHFGGHATNTM